MKKGNIETVPSDQQLEKEIHRTQMKGQRWASFRSVVSVLLVIAALSVLVTVLWFPVYRVTGNSMEPFLERGQIVVAGRMCNLAPGDVAALYYENKVLIRRVIGMPGDWIDIDDHGKVSVNDKSLEEEYLTEAVLGSTDLTYPYQVPEGCYFVMGDHRAVSVDSRMSSMGCIAKEKIAGKIIFCIWPLRKVGYIG